MTDSESTAEAESPRKRGLLRNTISRLPFSLKVTAHIIIIILLTGVSITAIIAWQFRSDLYRREFSQALTVYRSTKNLLLAHHRSAGGSFQPRIIDRQIDRLFEEEGDAGKRLEIMLPDRIDVLSPDETVLYDYANSAAASQGLPTRAVSETFQEWHDRKTRTLHLAGPLLQEKEHIGYLHVRIPTTIEQQLATLFRRTMMVTSAVLVFAVLLSMLFTKIYLAPIIGLTRAARRIRTGDFSQVVPVKTMDEIGVLTSTFNDMSRAMGSRLELMHRLQTETVRISRELDLEKLVSIMASIFTRMSGSTGFRLYLHREKENRLEVVSETGVDLLPKPESDQLTQMAFRERWAQYLKTNGRMDSEPGEVLEMAIPMLSGHHRVGVIRIGPRDDDQAYNDDILTILQTLAQHASVSLDNAELLERLKETQRIEQEMELAREIQQAMLPSREPEVPGYEILGGSLAAYTVGGDYFDYIQSRQNHLHCVLGDVSGKGVPAALIMSIVRSLMHSFSELSCDPAEVLRKVNHRITFDIEPEMFVTLAMVDLDAESHSARIVRAGHEPVLVLSPSGEIQTLAPGGTGVGLLDIDTFDALLQVETHAIEPGETLILFTDGVTEARNPDQEDFGMERLNEMLAAHSHDSLPQLFESIHSELTAFTTGTSQTDDITLLMIRRTDGAQHEDP